MGSRLSKAVRPHVKAVASPVPIAQFHHETNGNGTRQDSAPRLPDKFFYDDIDVAASTTTPTAASQRRNSAPACATALATTTDMEQLQDRAATFSLFLAEHRLMSIEYAATDPPPPPEEREINCLICCTPLPKEKDPRHAQEAIKPCRSCNNFYCGPCVKRMFTDACKDLTRMPPRCCVQIHLHHARPYLNKEEIAEFKSKYEEWSTPKPFYCPIPTCSTFIPERLLPERVRTKGKQRVDSGIGTPIAHTFTCPTCTADICADCRQTAHPNSMCNVTEFGIDAETAALLKSWGYKQCPKCGHGLKRMFGCNHMECRCGAHFCYGCLASPDQCGGGCYDPDDEDEEEEFGPNYPASEPDTTETTENVDPLASEDTEAAATQTISNETPTAVTPPQPITRPRNLDGGPAHFWEDQDLDFGNEPTDEDVQDRAWNCEHSFSIYKIPFAKALVNDPSTTEMECVKCWCPIHPEIEAHKNPHNAHEKVVPASASGRNGGMRRERGRRQGRAGGRYIPPRGLLMADTTIGTAPHLTTTFSPLSQSAPARETSPMEDVQFTERIVDTYGNIIATNELDTQRRASVDTTTTTNASVEHALHKSALSHILNTSDVFTSTPSKFSFAHECEQCGLLVCQACKAAILSKQEGIEEPEHDNSNDDDDDDAAPASLFD